METLQNRPVKKCVLLGATGVGKTCLLKTFFGEGFNDSEKSTLGVDFRSKDMERNFELREGENKYFLKILLNFSPIS